MDYRGRDQLTVLLVGVGADSTNASRCPPVYEDGRFEYIPIPEEYESIEELTYDNTSQKHSDKPLSEAFEYVEIDTHGSRDPYNIGHSGGKVNEYGQIKLHHDPNFRDLTFGDPGKTRSDLEELEPDNLIAFYTGLSPPEAIRPKHRYLIGFWIVDQVINFDEIPEDRLDEHVDRNRENAHLKRYLAKRDPHHLKNLVVVQGQEPGGLLPHAKQLSGSQAGGNYSMKDELVEAWKPSTTHLGGIKPTIWCDISPEAFISTIGCPEPHRPNGGSFS